MMTIKKLASLLVALVAIGLLAATCTLAAPSARPGWMLQSLADPTNFKPEDESGVDRYEIFLTNIGGGTSDGTPIEITDTLPAGLTVKSTELQPHIGADSVAAEACQTTVVGATSTVGCEVRESLTGHNVKEPARLVPGAQLHLVISVSAPASTAGALVNRVSVEGGGAEAATLQSENRASEDEAPSGLQEFRALLTGTDGAPATDAASHPYDYITTFGVNTELAPKGSSFRVRPADGDVKNIEVKLPPGLVGNPNAASIPRCTTYQFDTLAATVKADELGTSISPDECPAASAVGVLWVEQIEGEGELSPVPIYNLVPPEGMPAQLGFRLIGLPFYINARVRSEGDYGVTTTLENSSEAKRITAAMAIIWGVPGEASHDPLRGECGELDGSGVSCPSNEATVSPFLRLPTSCVLPLDNVFSFDTWQDSESWISGESNEPAPGRCGSVPFEPSMQATPTTTVADSSSGLHFDLHLPQPQGATELGEADLEHTTVTLPEGLVVNPSSADGLAGCSEAQVGYEGTREGIPAFSAQPAECPDASKIGAVIVKTPLLGHPLPGAVYLARQRENPFGSLIAIYITVYDPISGVVVKLPAEVRLDPVTGRLTTIVPQSPQVPFEDFTLDFFPGARAALTTPFTCGSYAFSSDLTPWSAPEGANATPSSAPFSVTGPGGGSCVSSEAQAPNAPAFDAGTASPVAATYSPFVLQLGREDGSQRFSGLNVTMPPGLIGKVAGLQQCPQAAIDAASARNREGEGALEVSQPSCPAGSEIGAVHVGAGSGAPFYATGHAYFAGPYEGAPFSLVIVTPAVAGPFDLGTVVVRAALYIDPSTAQVTVKSDPFPTILDGIPLDIRNVDVDVSRPEFTLNPTSCSVMSVTGQETSMAGQITGVSDRFQAGGCTTLPFHPVFAVSSSGKTSRKDGASLVVHVSSGAGQANIAKVRVKLPKQLPSRLDTLKLACIERVFAADPASCPAASAVGRAVAHTPILASPLTGPAYIVSHGGAAFPDLEVVLQGEGVTIVLDGKTNIKDGITESSFESVPDAPVSSFELNLPEGPHSILGAPSGLCSTRTVLVQKKVTVKVRSKGRMRKRRVTRKVKQTLPGGLVMPTLIVGQNGAGIAQNTPLKVSGCAVSAKKKQKRKKTSKAG